MATKKRKPMTARERKQNAEWRKEWRAKGILPPVKKPLNRKKFIEDARADYDATINYYDLHYLAQAVGCMTLEHFNLT